MEFTIDSAALSLTNNRILGSIHKELVLSTTGAFSPLLLVICNYFHLRGPTFYFCT